MFALKSTHLRQLYNRQVLQRFMIITAVIYKTYTVYYSIITPGHAEIKCNERADSVVSRAHMAVGIALYRTHIVDDIRNTPRNVDAGSALDFTSVT